MRAHRAGRVRKDKMMEELGEARLQMRQLKKQVLRLQQQLALAEKQATKAMEAHLPKPGDSYDDSFEAVLREEMMMMKAGFELKIQLLTEEVRTACGHVDRDARRRPSNRIVPTRLTLACDRDACATAWLCIGLLAIPDARLCWVHVPHASHAQNEDIVRTQRKEIRELTQKFNAYKSS